MHSNGDQLALDFMELEHEDARARLDEWAGTPLRFTTGFHAPTELDAAFDHWRFLNGRRDSIACNHMSHRFEREGEGEGEDPMFEEHRIAMFSASCQAPGLPSDSHKHTSRGTYRRFYISDSESTPGP